jgi:protein-S-isoprenylcysteine O-methyltransferase Ste14
MHFLELKIPPVAILLICITGMASAQLYLPQIGLAHWLAISIGSLFLLSGLLYIMLAVWQFRRHQTTVNPMQPESASQLLTTGMLSISRNPMYLGFVLLIIASGMALQSMLFPLVCSAFIVYMTHFQIIPEERALNALFPKDFNLYCQKTKRWI